jgi:phage-related protein
MPAWSIEFYESPDEGRPVKVFLDALDMPRRAKVLAVVQLLAEMGPTLPYPYSSQVRGKLRELRPHYGREQFRVLYFGGPGRMFVLLHAFVKHSAELPRADVILAQRRMLKYLQRAEGD